MNTGGRYSSTNLIKKTNMATKSTTIELVVELLAINQQGKYDILIEKAKSGHYHDVLKPPQIVEPKVDLCRDLHKFPELKDIRQDVLNGEYDELDLPPEIEDIETNLIN